MQFCFKMSTKFIYLFSSLYEKSGKAMLTSGVDTGEIIMLRPL